MEEAPSKDDNLVQVDAPFTKEAQSKYEDLVGVDAPLTEEAPPKMSTPF